MALPQAKKQPSKKASTQASHKRVPHAGGNSASFVALPAHCYSISPEQQIHQQQQQQH